MGKMNKLYIYSETVQSKISYNQVILNAFLTILDITCFVILMGNGFFSCSGTAND